MSKGTSLKKISTKQLEREITKRKVSELEIQKSLIEKKIKSLNGTENVVEKLNKKAKKALKLKKAMHKGRSVNNISLTSRLITVGSDGATRTTTEYLTALENDGWKSTSAKPYYVVAAALATLEKKNVFRRIAKGSYQWVNNEPVVANNV
jgi:hypothetical protein